MTRKILITGAGSGIGFSCVQHFLTKGAEVIGLDRNVSRLATLTSGANGLLKTIEIDLTDKVAIRSLFEQLDKEAWVPDVLINAAGIREISPVVDLDDDVFEQVIAVNLTAPFLLSRECAKRWLKNENTAACIVNIASVSGVMAEPERAAYVSSKHGLIGLTKQLAIEFGEAGIRVNAVSPGVIRTELTESYFSDPALTALIRDNHALKRWGTPEEIVSCIDFLASPSASFVTGANFLIDGGWTAGKKL
ncbi:SDR family NAD(P)-dependent oxidoreductase [Chitinimonas sp. PSY-7]|uniref:SDR family oxidoreductase n=1 Tax=Chitinimonas sp. PSY-7 TaxID=3459088 RepID=UPI00403FD3A2